MGKITNYDEDPVFELEDVLTEHEGSYETSPGGVCLNWIRTATWIGAPCSFIASIGKDRLAETMRSYMAGIELVLEEIPDMKTGAVLVLLKGDEHSHIGYQTQAVSSEFVCERAATMLAAKVIVSETFMLTLSAPPVLAAAKFARKNEKIFCFVLCADFLFEKFREQLLEVLKYTDYVFWNDDEVLRFAQLTGAENVPDAAEYLSTGIGDRHRTVVVTRGSRPVLIWTPGAGAKEWPVAQVESLEDTVGCGDSFAGAFMSQLAQEKSHDTWVAAGLYAASVTLQARGWTLPTTPSNFINVNS